MPERKHTRTFRSKKLHPEYVKLLNEAIRKNAKGGDHNVRITYRKETGEVSDRKIKPLGVKQKDLLLAHCHERNAVRSFKVGRISKMEKSASSAIGRRIAKIISGKSPRVCSGDAGYRELKYLTSDLGRLKILRKDIEAMARTVRLSKGAAMVKSAFWEGFDKRATSFNQKGIASLKNAFGTATPPPPPPPPPPAPSPQ